MSQQMLLTFKIWEIREISSLCTSTKQHVAAISKLYDIVEESCLERKKKWDEWTTPPLWMKGPKMEKEVWGFHDGFGRKKKLIFYFSLLFSLSFFVQVINNLFI